MIKNDQWILEQCRKNSLISPFVSESIRTNAKGDKVLSYGVSSFGYDLRCGSYFEIFTPGLNGEVVDPKVSSSLGTCRHEGPSCVIPPHSCVLTHTMERVNMPRSVLALCIGKSTYARCGILLNCTPIEPEFEGYITLEISNTSNRPVRIYSGEGIAQIIFFEGEKCKVSYNDRAGKYQNQAKRVVHAKV